MNEVSRANGTNPHRGQPQPIELSTDQAVESAALAGAAAIQKLVAERNELRTRLASQEQETAAYRALNNELRRRLVLVHQAYVEMAKGVVGDLERFDAVLRDSAQEAHATIEAQMHWEEPALPASAPAQCSARTVNGAQSNSAHANGAQPKGAAQLKP
ncbi:MAG: hypothetical protein AAF967_10125 [Pseudomonadota bacterium]